MSDGERRLYWCANCKKRVIAATQEGAHFCKKCRPSVEAAMQGGSGTIIVRSGERSMSCEHKVESRGELIIPMGIENGLTVKNGCRDCGKSWNVRPDIFTLTKDKLKGFPLSTYKSRRAT